MNHIELYKKYITGPFGDRIVSLVRDVSNCSISVPRSISSILNDVNGAYYVSKTIEERTFRDRLNEIEELVGRYEKNCKCRRI